MATKKKVTKDAKVLSKARQALAFAEERARHASDWIELHNALFWPRGQGHGVVRD